MRDKQPIKLRDTHIETKAGWVRPNAYAHRVEQVKRVVARVFEVRRDALDLYDKHEPLVFARFAAMAIAHEKIGGSLGRVARAFRKMNHATTSNAKKQHAALMECDKGYSAKVLKAERQLFESGVLTPDGTEQRDGLAVA